MGLTPGPVELKELEAALGRMPPRRHPQIQLAPDLCPPEVIDYVVVHELAHLKVPGHNPRFWGVVEKVLPDYASRRHWLNRAGTPFLLWRAEL